MNFGTGWYAVAIGGGLEAGTSAGTRLFDREIVIWRDEDGTAHAWEDRCPHRGMRLSFGFVRGRHIACLYHGWQYDTAGQCRYIPAHPDLAVPETIKVPTYPCVEAGGLIWIWSELAERAAEPLPAPPSGLAIRSLYVDAPASDVAAALDSGAVGPADEIGLAAYEVQCEGARLRLALQPFTHDRTALHLVRIAGDAAPVAIASWSEGLRRRVEAWRPALSSVAGG